MKLPKDYLYVARKSDGSLAFIDAGTYTCKSTCDGCEPTRLGETVGCSSCPRGSTATCVGGWGKNSQFEIGDGQDGKIISLKDFIKQMDSSEMLNSTYTFDELMDNELISQKFEELLKYLKIDSNQGSVRKKNMLFNFYGVAIILNVPESRFQQISKNSDLSIDDGSAACTCNSGSAGCVLEDIYSTGRIKIKVGTKCSKGGCYSCSMSGI